jgi:type I restriction enzyme S subunit
MSFPRYPAYKDSGVAWLGEVPGHWGVKRLRFVAALNPSKSEVNGLARETFVSFLPMDAIGEDGSLRLDNEKPISDLESGYTYFRDGDVALAKITPCYENGKGALMQGLLNGIGFGSTELIVARPKPDQVTGTYLHYLFISPDFRAIGESHMYGAGGQKRVPDAFVRDFAAAFPPIPEQTQIAAFLDRETAKIDALVAEQRRLMALLKEKRQAVISHAVTKGLDPDAPMKPSGIEWLGDVPAHWEVGPLKRFWSVTDCKHVTAEFVDDGFPLASIREVQSRWVALENAKCTTEHFYEVLVEGNRQPLAGDLIFSRNATVGEVAQVHADHPRFAMGQDVVLLRKLSPNYSSDYLQHVIRSPIIILQLANMMIGSTFKRINVEEIRSFLIPSPPPTEQAEIANFLEGEVAKFDNLTAEAQRAIDLLQERRTALISAAVTGQIDLREAVSIP